MSYGLEVRDSSGVVTLDTSRRFLRLIGVYSYPTLQANQSINIVVPNITNDGTWICLSSVSIPLVIFTGYVQVGPGRSIINYFSSTFAVFRG